jgi:hypothetical protein
MGSAAAGTVSVPPLATVRVLPLGTVKSSVSALPEIVLFTVLVAVVVCEFAVMANSSDPIASRRRRFIS